MKIALLIPPLGCITHPYSSLPSLTAHMRRLGHEVFQFDVGMRAFDRMLTPEYLVGMQDLVNGKIALYEKTKGLGKAGREHLRLLKLANLCMPHAIKNVDCAKEILRSPEYFYDPEKYMFAANVVRRCFDIFSAYYYPIRVSYDGVTYPMTMTFDNIYAFAENEEANLFLGVMRDLVLPEILDEPPPLVGISVTYQNQFFAGYTLARLVKEKFPDAHVVMGGATITAAGERICSDERAFRWVDSYVFGEGESALAGLADMVESGCSEPNGVANLYTKQDAEKRDGSESSVVAWCKREDFDELPVPDYSGMNIGDFLSPEPVLLISSARGCYYRKCAFCGVSLMFMDVCRMRGLEKLRNDIAELRAKTGARFFYFADDCIPPKRCREIANLSMETGDPFYWQCEIRYEKPFTLELLEHMARGGCRLLIIGNESGNQRVLGLMNKNTEVERNKEILRNARDAGIAVHLQNFLGFPGETSDEARDTVDFLIEMKDCVSSLAIDTFDVTEYSPVHREPEKFGITEIWPRAEGELTPVFLYETSEGMGMKEARQALVEAHARLGEAYYFRDDFLDLGVGVHAMLHYQYSGRTKRRDIFAAPISMGNAGNRKARVVAGVVSTQWDVKATLYYSPKRAAFTLLDEEKTELVGNIDGSSTLREISARIYERKKENSPDIKMTDVLAHVINAVHELILAGIVELD